MGGYEGGSAAFRFFREKLINIPLFPLFPLLCLLLPPPPPHMKTEEREKDVWRKKAGASTPCSGKWEALGVFLVSYWPISTCYFPPRWDIGWETGPKT